MSEDFECDFSEGSLCEKKAVYKKKQNDREIHLTNMNNNNKNSAHHFQIKKDSDKLKSSKLAKKNLKYFLIYYDGNLCHTIIRNILKERRLEISSDSEIDFSKNVYFMLIDYHRKLVEGILKKDYMKESIEDTTKKKLYKFKLDIKSRYNT